MLSRLAMGFLVAPVVKNLSANAGDGRRFNHRSGRSTGERNGNTLQYSCLENPKDRGAWQAIVHSREELDMTEVISMHAGW